MPCYESSQQTSSRSLNTTNGGYRAFSPLDITVLRSNQVLEQIIYSLVSFFSYSSKSAIVVTEVIMQKDLYKLIVSVSLCLFVGFAGSLVTFPSITTWYATLHKPTFSPPNWIFAPVWTFLYICMGIASYLIWQKGIKKKTVVFALKLFGMQLILNFLWSIIFFGFHSPVVALIDILLLLMTIFMTTRAFFPINKYAALLLIPYLLWVSFAAILNLAIVLLN